MTITYVIERKTKHVFIIRDSIMINEITGAEMEFDFTNMYNRFSEISVHAYNEFLTDAKDEIGMEAIKAKIEDFAIMAKEINHLWEDLSSEANDILATEYPFSDSFEEVADKILFWKETLDNL